MAKRSCQVSVNWFAGSDWCQTQAHRQHGGLTCFRPTILFLRKGNGQKVYVRKVDCGDVGLNWTELVQWRNFMTAMKTGLHLQQRLYAANCWRNTVRRRHVLSHILQRASVSVVGSTDDETSPNKGHLRPPIVTFHRSITRWRQQ
jgi:hypothetical protein